MFKRQLLTISPVLIGLALTGCATTQSWVPELEEAQKTYAHISQDPLVASLAADELKSAQLQLQRAQDASATYRKPQTVAHEARLATLQTLTAQQRARALSANHTLQVTIGQEPLLAEPLIAAATIKENAPAMAEPMMAVAHASDVHAQLALLSQQLAALQAQLKNQNQLQEPEVPQLPAITQQPPAISAPVTAPQSTIQQQLGQQLLSADNGKPGYTATTPIAPVAPTRITLPQVTQQVGKPTALAEPVMAAAISSTTVDAIKALPGTRQIQRKLMAMNAKPTANGMSLVLGERYFASGTASLMNQRATRHLDNVAAVLRQNPGLNLNIEGHTDNHASAQENQGLSVDRAISIKSALVLRGIEAARINTRGFGHTRPIADNDNPLGRMQNRRVELVFPVAQSEG